jgi:hypothetical protein
MRLTSTAGWCSRRFSGSDKFERQTIIPVFSSERQFEPARSWKCHVKGEASHADIRTRRSESEMVPDDSAALGGPASCVQSLQSGPGRSLSQHDVSNLFPASASRDERAFFPMPGIGVHDVAMGGEESTASISGAAQGILWSGRYSARNAVTNRQLRGARQVRRRNFDIVLARQRFAASSQRCARQINTTPAYDLLNK